MEEDLEIAAIKKRSIQGIFSLISRQFILQLISLGAFFIISTNLSSADIGIYTVVISIQYIISFFTDFGFGAALIQKKEEITQDEITTMFTIQASITFLVFVIVFLLRNIIASLFHLQADAQALLLVLVFTIFISSFKGISSILLERHIQFQKLVIPQIIESLTFNIILVILALHKFGVSSYTWAFLVSSIIGLPLYFYISPWKVRLGIHKPSLRYLRYGVLYQTKNVLANIKDNFLIAALPLFLPYKQIGYYGFAQKWAFFVYRYFVDSVTKVTFSTYARIQGEKTHVAHTIEKSLFLVSTVMFPAMTGVMLIMPYIITYIPKWHNKWEPAIVSIIFLSLNAMVSSLSGILVNVLDATGHVKKTLQLMGIWTLLTWILTPVMISLYGYNGVAIASFLVTLSIVYTIYLVKQIVEFNFLKSIYKPALSSLFMAIVVYFLSRFIVTNLMTLMFVILTAGAIYFFCMYLLAGQEFVADIKKVIKRHE